MQLTTASKPQTLPRAQAVLQPYSCRNCSDGSCPRCLDNLKWERRYEQLYGDAMREYYGTLRFPASVVNNW